MLEIPPPYRPLRGAEPPHFVERADEDDLDSAGIVSGCVAAYAAGPRDPRFHRLVCSAPGLGKTALLRAVARRAGPELGWAVASYQCRSKVPLPGPLTEACTEALARRWPGGETGRLRAMASHPSAREDVTSSSFFAQEPAEGPWARLSRTAQLAGEMCNRLSSGLLVALDDADRLVPGELEAVGHLARRLATDGLPVAFLLSGPLSLTARAARAGNFALHLWPTRLQGMDDCEAREALVVPAAERGVDIDEEALDLLCAAAGRSPLDLQRLGFAAWSIASGPDVVTRADAENALFLVCATGQRLAS